MLTSLILITLVGNSQVVSADITKLCETYMISNVVKGMSVVVMRDDQVTFAKGFGFADEANNRTASQDTIYRLGSVSKPVASAAALMLVEGGRLDLDKDIRSYVPEFPKKQWPISARQIMTHSSGIRHYALGEPKVYKAYTSLEALNLFSKSDLLFEPGTKYSYSTHAFTLLAAAMEKVSGRDFPSIIETMTSKVGAQTLKCEDLSKVPSDRSKLYSAGSNAIIKESLPPENNSWKYAGGGLESSAIDLARFASAYRSGKLVSSAMVKESWTRQASAPGTARGLGWSLNGDDYAEHSGSQQGSRSHLRIYRKSNLIIVILTNTDSNKNSPAQLTAQIADLLLAARR